MASSRRYILELTIHLVLPNTTFGLLARLETSVV